MISQRRSLAVQVLKDKGLTKKEIEEELGLSPASVRRYLRDSKQRKRPKIFLIDIETAPIWVRVWGLYRQRIPYTNIIKGKDWFKICWAGKWLGDEKVISDCVTPAEALARDDKRISKSIWKIVDEADVLIGQNLMRFDLRRIMARFIQNGLLKPRPFRTIDTLVQAKKRFALTSYSLDYMNSIFSLRLKEDTDYQLWIDCEEGEKEALKYMLHYCKSDVGALEDLYLTLRPYMTSHPNLALYVDDDDPMCPYCLSKKIVEEGEYTTNISVFPAYRCLNPKCGATPRGRKSKVTKEKREGLLISTVR